MQQNGFAIKGGMWCNCRDPSKPVMTISLMVPIIQPTPTDDILSAIDDSHNYGEYELFDSSVVTSSMMPFSYNKPKKTLYYSIGPFSGSGYFCLPFELCMCYSVIVALYNITL